MRAAIHAFDHELNLVDRLGVVPHTDEVGPFEVLIGNALRKRVLVIQRDFERRDAIVFQPRLVFIVFVISRLDQDAVEWQRTFHVKRYALANPIAFDSLNPGRLNLSGWIALYVNDVVIVFALGCQRRACRGIVIGVIEKVLMILKDVGGTALKIFF